MKLLAGGGGRHGDDVVAAEMCMVSASPDPQLLQLVAGRRNG